MMLKAMVAAVVLAVAGGQLAAAQRDEGMRFQGMDRDGDGVITRGEWRGNDRSFAEHDSNRDGVLSGPEVWPGGRRSDSESRTSKAPFDLFASVDANGNGTVTWDEWPGSAETFARLDVNRNGHLTREELSGTATQPGRSRAYDLGYERGLTEGRTAGRLDRERLNKWDLEGQRELEQADSGYRSSMGSRADYQAGYREAFRLAYREGWRDARAR